MCDVKRVVIGVMFLVMTATLSGCCGVCKDLDKSNDPEYMAKKQKELKTWRKNLKAIRSATPKTSKAAKKCPDEAIRKTIKDKKKTRAHTNVVTWEFLKTASSSKGKYKKGEDPWSWLIWDTLEDLAAAGKPKGAREINDLLYWLGHHESRHLIVVRGTMKPPKILDDPSFVLEKRATAEMGKHYEPGSIKAWAYVFDIETQKLLCQAPLNATSSPSVQFRTRGIAQKDHDDAIMDDFSDRVGESLGASLGSISEVLKR